MSLRTARVLTVLYLLAMAYFVTWPGFVPFARIRPLVLGLPFSLFFIAAWIVGAILALFLLDRVERRHRTSEDG